MFSANTYAARRAELCRRIGKGVILLPGNMPSPNNYPNNAYYFRQDSTFLYFFGLNLPSMVGVIDAETGEATLYGDDFTVEDIICTGPQPAVAELGAQVGVTKTAPLILPGTLGGAVAPSVDGRNSAMQRMYSKKVYILLL